MATTRELTERYANDMLRTSKEHFDTCSDPCDIWQCGSHVAAQYRVARKRYWRVTGDDAFAPPAQDTL